MESVSNEDCARLHQAAGDPVKSDPDPPFQDEQLTVINEYKSMKAAVILIGPASPGLERDHLRCPNLLPGKTSCTLRVRARNVLSDVFWAMRWVLDHNSFTHLQKSWRRSNILGSLCARTPPKSRSCGREPLALCMLLTAIRGSWLNANLSRSIELTGWDACTPCHGVFSTLR